MIRAVAVGAALLAAAACEPPPDDACPVRTTSAAVQAADRKILGAGAHYAADPSLRGREHELRRSQRARRDVAWQVVARVLAPTALATPLPGATDASVPAWQTWYGRDDLNRLFNLLYEGIGAERRAQRDGFADAELDDALDWNLRAVEELPNWPEDRWRAYLEAITSAEHVAGVAGINPVSYAPDTARHLLASYPAILACRDGGAPPPFADAPPAAPRRMLREPVRLGDCASQTYGPFFVAGGETLRAIADGAELSLRQGDAALCSAGDGVACEVTGPATVHVTVLAGPGGVDDGVLTIDYDEASPTWAACLDGAFAPSAVAVKASWHRAQLGQTLPVYHTSAAALGARLDGDADWGPGDEEADPGPADIYTLELPNGNRFRLAGLHIATKELDHWLWITLWWSASPDVDFGADRPAAIRQLGGPWSHYKMCVTSMFDELDPDPSGGFDHAPSLAAALARVHRGAGAPSWCSNPYIELGAGNAGTNCIGCHQHAGAGLLSEDILADPDRFPGHGTTWLRNNFPHDYSFAVDAGDRLGGLFADVVEYFDGVQ